MVSDPSGQDLPDVPSIDWPHELAKHDRWLRAVVYTRLGNQDEVDEVMQEVALAAVKQSSPIREREKVAPWLYRLAVRQSLLFRRTAGRQRNMRKRFADRERPTERDERQPEPMAWLLSQERASLVRQAVEELQPRDAELLLLKYVEHWSYQEIAEHLGVSHSAVESRLHRARARLRDRLTAHKVIEANQ